MKYLILFTVITLINSCSSNSENTFITIINNQDYDLNKRQYAFLKLFSQSRDKEYYKVLNPIKSHLKLTDGGLRTISNVFKIHDFRFETHDTILIRSEILDDNSLIILLVRTPDINVRPNIEAVKKLIEVKECEYKIIDVKFDLSQNLKTKFRDKFDESLFYNQFE